MELASQKQQVQTLVPTNQIDQSRPLGDRFCQRHPRHAEVKSQSSLVDPCALTDCLQKLSVRSGLRARLLDNRL